MTKHTLSIKLSFAILCLCLLAGSAFAFAPSQNPASQSSSNPLSIVGRERGCYEYRSETGTFIGAKTITSQKYPALVNIYIISSNGDWQPYKEFEAPVSFSGGNRQYGYEIYYCPPLSTTCSSGEVRGITETSFQMCMAGFWSESIKCDAGTYYDPERKTCRSYTCKEAWTCGSYGQCTADGKAYRTCSDTNDCGTFEERPSTSQTCTPVSSTGVTTAGVRSGIQLIGNPTASTYDTKPGTPLIVTQEFDVKTPGQYWIEAGIEQYRGFVITADVEGNTCNPDEPWYANELVTFTTTGRVTKTFQVTPTSSGEWVLHTATVTGCGGDVAEQRQASDRIIVTSESTSTGGKSNPVGGNPALTLGLLGAGLLTISYFVWRKRR